MSLSPEEKLIFTTALGIPQRTFANKIDLADLPPGLVEHAERQLGQPPVACRILYDPLTGAELHIGIVCLRDLSPDQLAGTALMAKEGIRRGRQLLCLCASAEVAKILDGGPFIDISGVIKPPVVDSFTESVSAEADEIYVAATLQNVERMIREANPTLPADAAAQIAVDIVTHPQFFHRK